MHDGYFDSNYNYQINGDKIIVKKQNLTESIIEILLVLFNDSSTRQHQIKQIERRSEELHKMKDFYRQKSSGTRKLY